MIQGAGTGRSSRRATSRVSTNRASQRHGKWPHALGGATGGGSSSTSPLSAQFNYTSLPTPHGFSNIAIVPAPAPACQSTRPEQLGKVGATPLLSDPSVPCARAGPFRPHRYAGSSPPIDGCPLRQESALVPSTVEHCDRADYNQRVKSAEDMASEPSYPSPPCYRVHALAIPPDRHAFCPPTQTASA